MFAAAAHAAAGALQPVGDALQQRLRLRRARGQLGRQVLRFGLRRVARPQFREGYDALHAHRPRHFDTRRPQFLADLHGAGVVALFHQQCAQLGAHFDPVRAQDVYAKQPLERGHVAARRGLRQQRAHFRVIELAIELHALGRKLSQQLDRRAARGVIGLRTLRRNERPRQIHDLLGESDREPVLAVALGLLKLPQQ